MWACVAWMRIVVSEVAVRRRECVEVPEGRKGLYEKRVLKKEFVVGEVVFLLLELATDESTVSMLCLRTSREGCDFNRELISQWGHNLAEMEVMSLVD